MDTLIQVNQADIAVRTMCQYLNLSTSGYYEWRDRKPCPVANRVMAERIRAIPQRSDATYGRPRIHAELRERGEVMRKNRVARLMQLAPIKGVSRRRGFGVTTQRGLARKATPDWVKPQFVATGINQLWVADMTDVPPGAGFIYLAVVIDVYSRKAVGWAFDARMTADWVIAALNRARVTRKPKSVIHHSDQGSQYTSVAFGKRCEKMGVKPSLATVGDAYDNAMAESFFASLECELIARRCWKTMAQAGLAIFAWIEAWYNPHRRHKSIEQQSPINFERTIERKKKTENHPTAMLLN